MRGSKIPVQELWLKMGGGRIREGGRNSGILRYLDTAIIVILLIKSDGHLDIRVISPPLQHEEWVPL